MNIDDFSAPSKTLGAADLEGDEVTLTIKSYVAREFEQEDMKTGEKYKQKKPVFSFMETEKTLVCNKTNREAIAAGFNDKEMDNWIGRKITLYPTVTPVGHESKPCIRVRILKEGGSKPKFLKNGPKDEHPFAPGNNDELDDEVPF